MYRIKSFGNFMTVKNIEIWEPESILEAHMPKVSTAVKAKMPDVDLSIVKEIYGEDAI